MLSTNPRNTGPSIQSLVAPEQADTDCPLQTQHEEDIAEFSEYADITEKQAWDFWYCFECFEFLYDFIDEMAGEMNAYISEQAEAYWMPLYRGEQMAGLLEVA